MRKYRRNTHKKENGKILVRRFCHVWNLFSLKFGFIHLQLNLGDPNELVSVLYSKSKIDFNLLTWSIYSMKGVDCKNNT